MLNKRLLTVTLLVFALILAGCGGDSEEQEELPTRVVLDDEPTTTEEPTNEDNTAADNDTSDDDTSEDTVTEDPTPTPEGADAADAGAQAADEDSPLRFTYEASGFRFVDVDFSPDNSAIAFSDGEVLRIVDTTSGELISEFSPIGGSLTDLAYSPDGSTIAYYDGGDDSIYFIDLASGDVTLFASEDDVPRPVEQIVFSPDGTLLAHSGGNSGRIVVINVTSGEGLPMVTSPNTNSHNFIFSADGTQLFGNDNSEIQVHDAATGELVNTITPEVGRIYGLATDTEGAQLYILGDNAFAVWDLAGNTLATSYEFERNTGQRFAVTDSGNRMVVNLVGQLPVMDPMTGETIIEYLSVARVLAAPFEMDISPDGTLLAHGTLTGGGTLYVWEMPSE